MAVRFRQPDQRSLFPFVGECQIITGTTYKKRVTEHVTLIQFYPYTRFPRLLRIQLKTSFIFAKKFFSLFLAFSGSK